MNIITLDVGGTAIKYAYFQKDDLIFQSECPSEARLGGQRLIENMKQIIHSCLEKYPADAIGISTTGQVDANHGSILFANDTIPDYIGMNVKMLLEAEFHLPVYVENDVNAAAIGESVYGAGKNHNDFIMVTYGTGIGGAIVINKHVYKGADQVAGEIGHMRIHSKGPLCGCGSRGCYETYASTTALIKKAMLLNPSFHNGKLLFEAFHANDPEVKALIDDWITEISYGLINLVYLFNPSCIILGGGIMSQEYICQRLQEIVSSNVVQSFRAVRLYHAALGNLAGVYGMKAICNGSYKES